MSARCKFCGEPLVRRLGEKKRDFIERRSCNRSCHVAWKNAKPIWQSFAELTESKIGGCIEWKGYRDPKGYGRITTPNGVLAHRVAYRMHFGVDPRNELVCHRCDNPSCVNPHHLFLGSNQDNMDDMVRKGRKPPQYGRDNPNWRHGRNCSSPNLERGL